MTRFASWTPCAPTPPPPPGKTSPLASLELCLDQRLMHRGRGAHDRSSDFVCEAYGNARSISCRRGNVLLVCSCDLESSRRGGWTPLLHARPAPLAVLAHAHHRLDARSVAGFPVLDALAELDNDASAFVTGRANIHFVHLNGQWQVLEHVVDIRHTQSGAIESGEDFIVGWECQRIDTSR